MNKKLPETGSIVLYLDEKSKKQPDHTGYNQIGVVISENQMMIQRKSKIVIVDCIESKNEKFDTINISKQGIDINSFVQYFKKNKMNVHLFNKGIHSLTQENNKLFDNPILMPEFNKLSTDDFNKKWKSLEEKAQIGDLIFTFDENSIISKIIANFDNGIWSHVGNYVGNGEVCEAITSGLTKRHIRNYKNNHTRIGLYRIRSLTQDKAYNMKLLCESQIGSPYNYWGVIKLAFKMLLGLKSDVPSPNGLIYSIDDLYLVEYI